MSSGERQGLLNGADVKPNYHVPGRSSGSISLNNGDVPNISTRSPPSQGGMFSWLFGGTSGTTRSGNNNKAGGKPVKAEPKVFFANERTFLAWLNMSVTLSSIAVAILAFSENNEYSQVYGFLIMPVAIGFSIYALVTYVKRANMLRNRVPYGYEDRRGPTILAVLMALAIFINMTLKIVDIYSSPSASTLPHHSHSITPTVAPAPEPIVPPAPGHGGKGKSSPSSSKGSNGTPPIPEPVHPSKGHKGPAM